MQGDPKEECRAWRPYWTEMEGSLEQLYVTNNSPFPSTAHLPPLHQTPLATYRGLERAGQQQDRVTSTVLCTPQFSSPTPQPPHYLQIGVFDTEEKGQAWVPREAVRMQGKQVGCSEKELELSEINLGARPCSQRGPTPHFTAEETKAR